MPTRPVSLFLCGDVMLGRGIDQILPYPSAPVLREAHVGDATTYVELAEDVNGPIDRPVDFAWPWGDALRVLDEVAPDARVLNLETSITRSDDFAPGKAVHYRMNPANLPCLAVARPDVCVLANNHVLDFGHRGLAETLDTLSGAGLTAVGAGRDVAGARRPAVVATRGGGRVVVFSFGTASSGIPRRWAATGDRAGVDLLPDLSPVTAAGIVDRVRRVRRPYDVVVASIHWGSNWGYDVCRDQTRFAHDLVEGGVDVVHGHSSHHPRPIEVYRGRLILYGCGDFIDDYEGISGYEEYRDDLRLQYFVSVEPQTGELAGARLVPLQARRMRLRHASRRDCAWLCGTLNRISRGYGARVALEPDRALVLV
ncbi:CapA family protein [Planosporangium thailandense]|uniref:CapA family protein n=1 Tax=Planosporangium thailandense TaxID=765197 RepID=A0ABX0Y8C6_9ACTN|nr:CapA family protein [Planosporangium thailandense]